MSPFRSEKQRAYMWMKHPEIARKWTKKYGGKIKPKGNAYTEALKEGDRK